MSRQLIIFSLAVFFLGALSLGAQEASPTLWPEEQRAFLQDGPAYLLEPAERDRFAALDEAERQRFMEEFLARDPLPETPENELREGIRRRLLLIRNEGLLPSDDRAQLLFLRGPADERKVLDCGSTFKPVELWGYGPEKGRSYAVLYQPDPMETYRLWLPSESKRVLYTPELQYFLEQWEELRGFIFGKRFDYQLCEEARRVDRITGVDGLFGYEKDRPTDADMMRFLAPPDNLGAWARRAAATAVEPPPEELPVEQVELLFPEWEGQRIVTRVVVRLPQGVELATAEAASEGELEDEEPKEEIEVTATGLLEQDGQPFEDFRVRYTLPAPEEPRPIALVLERPLRPGFEFLLRLTVKDEIGGAEQVIRRGFRVPDEPEMVEEPEVPENLLLAIGQQLSVQPMEGEDSLVIVPPEADVVLGLWRAEILTTGTRIAKVVFSVDGQVQLTRTRPPYTAELRLSEFPAEQLVRVEGLDEDGELVAADEVILNQPRGALNVRITDPPRGRQSAGQVQARAQVVVPEGKRVEKVTFLVDDVVQTTLDRPPWEAVVTAPEDVELSYLTVVVELDDGARAEDVRFLRSPQYLEEVDVSLVELYTTVTDRSGSLVRGLTAEDFEVFEDGRRQEIKKFELVENLPLTVGITIDTSGSMSEALFEAQQAAVEFLESIVTRRDRCFALSFASRPVMLMPPTNDVDAVARSLEGLAAVGMTSLHDALVHSLYYYRGVTGRRALVVLSDGDDTASNIPFRNALEYARRSGVAVYTIALDVGALDINIRNKLQNLSSETGGRSFFVKDAEALRSVYAEIESELRSQYLVAYAPDRNRETEGGYREVEVKVQQRGLRARTTRGYYE